ncbi:serine/threonine transporter [Actinobacillus genomosp. 1]|uniref:serine/threonine transporter n=1 Tax=Actinobacillus genomosp. 1 TaxID=254839 RepID=UPI002441C48F|nr:serine/threonine transporter [Actinobacillus genomosp. 1]WGE34868.1 serine/threonine transporter [Actinobacillus genomosp. 1]WGE36851.1 serine/threonine transporter [Actinobacillus genomosp. 1]
MATPSNRFSLTWVLNLFGTAVGAGVLFLPINAGMSGFYPLIVMTLLVGPMTYLAHRGLARFVLSSGKPGSDITNVVREHFGENAGKFITLLYFFAIFPILLIYGVGITNTVGSFIENQLHMAVPPRALLSGVLIAIMISVMLMSEQVMLKITTYLVYPLVLILFGLSIYLIPEWNGAALQQMPSTGDFLTTLWLTIPVLVFAFNHSPAISSFALSQQKHYQDPQKTEVESSKVLRSTATILVLFVMFFVFSCVLTLTPEELAQAKAQNISILSYLANKFDNPVISYFGPLVAFLAIGSSFFGHYLGAREGLEGLVNQLRDKPIESAKFQKITAVIFFITLWIVATINPSILGFIESLGGPIIAMILFIMPVYAIYTVPALAKYRNSIMSNTFVVVMGTIAISAIVYGLL